MGTDRAGVTCPVELTLTYIGNKWKVLILRELFRGGIKRFGELQSAIGNINQKTLTEHLRQMQRDGLIVRTAFPEVPPRVEYSLTELGRSLRPVMSSIYNWGTERMSPSEGGGQ